LQPNITKSILSVPLNSSTYYNQVDPYSFKFASNQVDLAGSTLVYDVFISSTKITSVSPA